jgi:hypothetical protein
MDCSRRLYRGKAKGKVERPYRYIREDFFLARSFRNLDDLNAQTRYWLDMVANLRVHATTQRVVNEALARRTDISKCCRWRRSMSGPQAGTPGSGMRVW